MIHAYHEMHLSKAQAALGEAFDYAINSCEIAGDIFVRQFAASSVSLRLEKAESLYLTGRSGIEIARDIISETMGKELSVEPVESMVRSKEYWIGWAAAYYQWYSGRKYSVIFKALTYDELQRLYYTLHEADVSKFADIADARIRELYPETNLKRIRTIYGCTQAELARKSGVSLRSIQMYEQRNKDINKAKAETLYRIALILGCAMEDLIEG